MVEGGDVACAIRWGERGRKGREASYLNPRATNSPPNAVANAWVGVAWLARAATEGEEGGEGKGCMERGE